jgi:hypothetical protein
LTANFLLPWLWTPGGASGLARPTRSKSQTGETTKLGTTVIQRQILGHAVECIGTSEGHNMPYYNELFITEMSSGYLCL